LLEDVLAHKPNLVGLNVDIRPMVVHLGGGSYKNVSLKAQAEWLKAHEDLFSKPKTTKRTNSKKE